MDTLTEEMVHPCEPATTEEFSDAIWGIAQGFPYDVGLLGRIIHPISEDCIPYTSIRCLSVLGRSESKCNDILKETKLRPGTYINRTNDGLLLVHPKSATVQRYMKWLCAQLNELELYNTTFATLDFTSFPALERLVVANNHEVVSINGLVQLTNLCILDVSGCSSLVLLPGLGDLTNLFSLRLSQCVRLVNLNGLEKLTNLSTLVLSGCSSFKGLPSLKNLTNLTTVELSDCSSLIRLYSLEKLTNLEKLSLTGSNNITELNLFQCENLLCISGLSSLKNLTYLNLSGCGKLTELRGLENLSSMVFLDLSGTAITELPDSICDMKFLKYLNISKLRLNVLPYFLPEIASKFWIDPNDSLQFELEMKFDEFFGVFDDDSNRKAQIALFDTSIENADMSVFNQPYEMVVKWFEDRKRGRTQPLNEIKVVFLGDGEAGKSHTIARLMNDGGEPDYQVFDGQSTPGIVIRNKEYDLDGRKIQVHYWDFGGQEIMHSMHRIFLTGRTMYVILLNARDDTQGDRAKYWLHNVKSFAPDAPVLLVLNKIDQNENASVDEKDLRSRYEKLTQVVRLSARDFSQEKFNAAFTNVLLDEIKNTGFLDTQWPIAWTQVKDKLEYMTDHYILGDDYEAICKECQVDANQKDLLHWFNDLGISFCCCSEEDYDLKDYVILRPDWITNALYIILFNKLYGARNGLIPRKTIYNLLGNACNNPNIRCTLPQARYNSGDIGYVLGIMRKFNISFADNQKNEFIPMLCQQNSTVDVQYYRKDMDTLEFNMEFDYLPNNLLHRLMVDRCDELDMDNVWRTGARFQLKELGYSAVVVIDSNVLRFFIRHTNAAHRPNTYLTMLKANVDRIVEKMGLKPPTCQLIYKLDGKQDAFDYEMLKAMLETGQTQAFSMTWRRMLPIEDILNQSAPDGLEDERKLLDAIVRSCQNIQEEPCYYLNGNDRDKENLRNRRVRSNLQDWGYNVQDQTQRGLSRSGNGIGEIDILINNDQKTPWTIIEGLRVSNGTKTDWNEHLDKLIGNYNYFGARFLYLLTYVDADVDKFGRIWKGYQDHIKKYNPGKFTYLEDSFTDLSDANSPQYIKTAKCQYCCGENRTTVYHIFAQIPLLNK